MQPLFQFRVSIFASEVSVNVFWVRQQCLSFPHATEQVTWGADLTFRIAGKIFAVTALEVAPVWLSFKCSPENFIDLTERAGIIPAPYLARAQWVALETKDALPLDELAGLLRQSYDLVVAKLPKKLRDSLSPPPKGTLKSKPRPHSPKKSKPTKKKKSKPNKKKSLASSVGVRRERSLTDATRSALILKRPDKGR
jgi:predicted DNA-binding protein (MmcQ/YjbR family)